MKISVIIPIYNVEPYIERCLRSVASQTYQGSIECLLVDDCGSDRSMELAEHFVQNYSGPVDFKILRHDHNRGLSAARNTGIKAATGDYVYFLDSDDEITEECISLLVRKAEEWSLPDMIVGSARIVGTVDTGWLELKDKKLPTYSNNKEWIKNSMLRRFLIPMVAWNKLTRQDFIIKNNLYFKEGIIHEDECWNFYVAKVISNIAFVNDITYLYYYNNNSITTSPDRLLQRKKSYEIFLNDFIQNIDPFCMNAQMSMIESLYRDYMKLFFSRLGHIEHQIAMKSGNYVRKRLSLLYGFLRVVYGRYKMKLISIRKG